MCGIAGILRKSGTSYPMERVAAMTEALRHRGPDDEGCAFFPPGEEPRIFGGTDTPDAVLKSDIPYLPKGRFEGELQPGARVAFGHRRLSILDLSPAGHQPMSDPSGRYWIVYNGEIYNYLELRKELAKEGVSFVSGTDTEVLIQALIRWGVDAFSRFTGMFSFAFLDREENTVLLARDFFGIKPLFYHSFPGGLVFASEIKALLALPHVPRVVEPSRVYGYLRRAEADYGDKTLFSGIFQLPAAHYARVNLDDPGTVTPVRYFDLETADRFMGSEVEAAERVRELFLRNIDLHLRSDVPVGAALSGGIDSSAIVCAMRRVAGESLGLHAFSFVASDPAVNEEAWVDLAGKASKAQIHKVEISPEELVRDLDALIKTQDEPFGSTSMYAQYRVMKLARENSIPVMLDGQGADELLAGYRHYFGAALAGIFRSGRLVGGGRFLRKLLSLPGVSMADLVKEAGKSLLPPRLARAYQNYGPSAGPIPYLKPSWFAARGADFASPAFELPREGGSLKRSLYRSLMNMGLAGLLRYEDRNSMAFSIESRVPFLTPDLARFVLGLPARMILDETGTTKKVFRDAMRGVVPDPILDRKDKIGFATPEGLWLTTLAPWVEETMEREGERLEPLFDIRAMKVRWEDVKKGRAFWDPSFWRSLCFFRWARLFDMSLG